LGGLVQCAFDAVRFHCVGDARVDGWHHALPHAAVPVDDEARALGLHAAQARVLEPRHLRHLIRPTHTPPNSASVTAGAGEPIWIGTIAEV
jgi:hypothetical protein